jgi:hypothetical protein
MTTNGRKGIHVYLTPNHHELWHTAAAENGVTVSALLELLALDIAMLVKDQDLIQAARKIDATRRRRNPRTGIDHD